MTSFLLEGRAAQGKCQNGIKCDDFHILFLLVKRHSAVKLKSFDPERTSNLASSINNIF